MASVDGARSVQSSFEESFQFRCTPCENDGVIKEAKFLCPECRDYLCDSCELSHKRFRSTRDHKVVLASAFSEKENNLMSDSDDFSRCPCNRNEAKLYCRNHNEDCKAIKHRQCEVVSVSEKTLRTRGQLHRRNLRSG